MEIGVPLDMKKFIRNEIKSSDRRQIVNLVSQAYKLVDESLKDVSFLRWFLGKQHTGYLDHIAVQFLLFEASKNGTLNFNAEILPNLIGTSHHVELKTDNVLVTVNRAKDRRTTARKAIYRTILQSENQLFWSLEGDTVKEEPGYIELTHNHKNREVDFVVLGVPNGKGKWYSSIDLTKEPRVINTPTEETNNIKEQQLVRFKRLAQGVHDSGGTQ